MSDIYFLPLWDGPLNGTFVPVDSSIKALDQLKIGHGVVHYYLVTDTGEERVAHYSHTTFLHIEIIHHKPEGSFETS